MSLTTFDDSSIEKALEILIKIGFTPVGEPVFISGNNENQRQIAFLVHDEKSAKAIKSKFSSSLGIQRYNAVKV